MVDPGEGPGGPPPLFLDQTEAQRAEKKFFWTPSRPLISGPGWPPSLSEGLDPPLRTLSASHPSRSAPSFLLSLLVCSLPSFLHSARHWVVHFIYMDSFIFVLSTSQTKNKLSTVTRLKLPMQASLKKFLVRWILTMSPSRYMGLGRHPWRQTLKGEAPKLSFSIPGHTIHVLGLNARTKTEARELRNESLCSWRKLAPFFHFTLELKNEIEKTNVDDDDDYK